MRSTVISIFVAAEKVATADMRITALYCRSMPAFLLVVSLCGVLAKVGGIMLADAVVECHGISLICRLPAKKMIVGSCLP